MNRRVLMIVGLALLAIGLFLLFQTVTATDQGGMLDGATLDCGSIFGGADHSGDCAPIVSHQWVMARGFLGAGCVALLGVALRITERPNPPGPALF